MTAEGAEIKILAHIFATFLDTDGAARIIIFLWFFPTTLRRGMIRTHVSRVAPVWDLWRTLDRLIYGYSTSAWNETLNLKGPRFASYLVFLLFRQAAIGVAVAGTRTSDRHVVDRVVVLLLQPSHQKIKSTLKGLKLSLTILASKNYVLVLNYQMV